MSKNKKEVEKQIPGSFKDKRAYNVPKINNGITMLGYIISLMTLIIMIVVISYDKNRR